MVSGTEKDREHWRFRSVQARGCLSVTRRSGKQRDQQRQLTGYLAMRKCEVVGMGGTRLGDNASDIARLTRTALNRSYNDDTSTAASDEAAGPAGRCRAGQTPLHDNDANTVRGARPGQDPVGHDVGGTDPVEPDSNIYDDTNVHNNTNTSDDEGDAQSPAAQLAARSRSLVGLTSGAACFHKTANDVWRGGVLLGSLGEANKRMGARRGASTTAKARNGTSAASTVVPPRRRWL